MANGGVMDDLPLPLNPPIPLNTTSGAGLKIWTNEQKLLLISLVHEFGKAVSNEVEPPWEEISRKLQTQKTKQKKGANWCSPQQCKRQYRDLMSKFELLLQADERLKSNRTSATSKQELLLQTIASATIRTSERKEEEIKKKIQSLEKTINALKSGELDNNLSDISDGEGSDSETEETMSHPFFDEDSFIEGLKRAFTLLDDTFPLARPNIARPVALADMESNSSNSESMRPSTPPSFSTSEFKKGTQSNQSVSPQLKNLVHTAIAEAAQEDKTKTVAPTNAPTLSRLLEMPIRDRGQPLPQINSLMKPSSSSTSEPEVILLDTPLSSPSKLESPSKLLSTIGSDCSSVKIGNDCGRQGGSLPSITLSMPASTLKPQDEIELANAFVIASGLLPQDATESYDMQVEVSNPNTTFQMTSPMNVSTLTTSSQPSMCETEETLAVSQKNVELGKEDVDSEVPLTEKNAIIEEQSVQQLNKGQTSLPVTEEKTVEISDAEGLKVEESFKKLPSIIPSDSPVKKEASVMSDLAKEIDQKEKLLQEPSEEETKTTSDIVLQDHAVEEESKSEVESKPLDDVEQSKVDSDGTDMKEKSKSAVGRGKKCAQEKSDELASAPLTRNSIKEKGVKLEEPQLNVKKPTKETTTSAPATVTRRSVTRSGPHEEAKAETKSSNDLPSSPTKAHGVGQRKVALKPSTEVSTPNLRSRRGATPTLLSNQVEDSGNCKVVSTQRDIEDSVEVEKKQTESPDCDSSVQNDTGIEASEADKLSPKKTNVAKEKSKEREKSDVESIGDQSDVHMDEDSRPLSGLGDESCDNEDASRKKPLKPGSRKERTESGEMADDDNSNSGFDAQQKKRLTRRSVKVAPVKSEEKSRENSADGKEQETGAGKDIKIRHSKTLSRLKHLNEEAHQLFGDIEINEEDANGKRLTRARTKTSSSPRVRTKSSGSSKGQANVPDSDVTGDGEPGPSRATRSRVAAAVTGSGSSNPVVDAVPTLPIDSNPSSPSSSTTNSTILEEDKDQKAFRKSVMLVWNRIAAHRYAPMFMKPISDDTAPGYSQKVKRPMDLLTIKKNIETGVTKTFVAFERDIYLMFFNCFMFNSVHHSLTPMAKEMETDSMTIIQEYKNTQQLLKSSNEGNESTVKKDGVESDPEQESHEEIKPKPKQSRKRRNRSNSNGNVEEVVEIKRRTLRTSTTAATTATTSWQGTRKGKNQQASPDIIPTL